MTAESEELPEQSRVVRYVPYGRMRRDEDDNFIGPAPSAFACRPAEEYLSVTWCEYFGGEAEQQLRCAIEALRNSEMDVKPKACFCVAKVAEICAVIAGAGKAAKAVYHPTDDNLAHAGLYGVQAEDAEIMALLADETWAEFLTKVDADSLPLSDCPMSQEVS
ncbi:hypothetical protein K3758_01165 [Sulfitobacter sp. W002]|uniref:hypothetical protein n=1 Tax=Sulfitobacter sp. W002 TaxID=2867024 RepID=UPI0021A272CC|nr:hypothetical protein [Sulfitobacter sp. W002]UWR30185.1 hypothetical protein K3758_01165 [Sulfitobacter sp. W002]